MDLRTQESKRAARRKLAALPVVEKLRLLDAMREREVSIGRKLAARGDPATPAPGERSAPAKDGRKKTDSMVAEGRA